mgnify:CR=1 FL=1
MQFNNLSVVEFNNIIKNIFDSEEMLFNCAVVGEISSFKITNNIAYFTIKDEYAVLSCVWFSPDKDYKIGEKVKVVGKPNYYVKGGKLNFVVNFLTSFGEGEIYKKFLELKKKLSDEGYFLGKKELPEIVNNIGVVSSSKGAVIRDIISVATRRNPNINIFIYPANVQGINAEKEIIKGIEFFENFDVDVVIVARGGGSNEDLSVFNLESVAKCCYKFSKPIISAVGHETDYTLIDFVADIRASTPSVAAEIAVKETKNYKYILNNEFYKLNNLLNQKLKLNKLNIFNSTLTLTRLLKTKLNNEQSKLKASSNSLNSNIKLINTTNIKEIENLYNKLINANPLNYLEKGFAIVSKNNIRQKDFQNINLNDEIEITMQKEKVTAVVTKKENLWVTKKS